MNNPQLEKLIEEAVYQVADECDENLMRKYIEKAYKAGAHAAIEATKLEFCSTSHAADSPSRHFVIGWNNAKDEQQALSDQFIKTLTDTQ